MSEPKFKNQGNAYFFDWEQERLTAQLSRIRSHSDGRITCRIVWTQDGGHLWQKDGFNLSACNNPINRKELTTRCTAKLNWTEILETVSINAIAEFEKGEPVELLHTGKDVERPEYLISPFLVKGFPTIMFGDPSSGKTTFSLFLATILMILWDQNPLNLKCPDDPAKVLYLDWETGKDGIIWQLTSLQRGMELPEFDLPYRRCYLPLADDFESIRDMVVDHDIQVVIIDSLGLASGGELKETSGALAFFRALGRLNVTSLILAHTPKDKENRTIYGNRYFEAEARSIWEIRKKQDEGSDEISIALFNTKPLPWDKLAPNVGCKMTFSSNGTGTVLQPQDPKTVQEFIERMGTQMRILALLKDGIARSPKTISEELGITAVNARVTLYNLKEKGKVVKLGETYGLSYHGREGVND